MSWKGRDDEDDEETSIGGSSRRPIGPHEFPDESDSGDDTDPCPHCGAMIYVDGEWCPKCGMYLVKDDQPSVLPGWAATVVVLIVVAMTWMLLRR